MLDTWQIGGTVGTWVAVLLTLITLTAIIGPWLLLRQAYNARNRALNAVQDCDQDYVTKGIGFSKLVRFLRKTKVPSLAPNFDSWSYDIPLKITAANECWTAKYPDPTSCRTGWAIFCRLLEAYSTSQGGDRGTSRSRWWCWTAAQSKSLTRGNGYPVVLPFDGTSTKSAHIWNNMISMTSKPYFRSLTRQASTSRPEVVPSALSFELQYRAIALGIVTEEVARWSVPSILSSYRSDPSKCSKFQLLLNRETCKWSMKKVRKGATCKFIAESLIEYGDSEEKEDVALVEDVILVTLWACVRAELWLGSLNGDDLMVVVRDLKRTVHLI